jgi:hypothetical protein
MDPSKFDINISVISWRHIQIEFKSEGGYFDKNKEVNLA